MESQSLEYRNNFATIYSPVLGCEAKPGQNALYRREFLFSLGSHIILTDADRKGLDGRADVRAGGVHLTLQALSAFSKCFATPFASASRTHVAATAEEERSLKSTFLEAKFAKSCSENS